MTIKLPKDLRGVLFPRLLSIELNDFDIDVFLPSLFFTILASGKGRARRANDPQAIARYIDALAQHPSVEGFDNSEGRRVLDRLVRTSLIVTGRVGQSKRSEQIQATVPYTILAHKPGFPTESSRQRNADSFIYQIMKDNLGSDGNLREHMKRVFGHGVNIGNQPALGGSYDGRTELDTLTRLSIALLDGMQPAGVGGNRTKTALPACYGLARELGTDMLRYLFAYHAVMPAQSLTYYFQGLINFELFIYTLKLVHGTNALVNAPSDLPPAMRDVFTPSPPQVYLDFTGETRGLSQEMARGCVRRDLEAYERFLGSNLLLRLLDKYAGSMGRNATRRAEISQLVPAPEAGSAYLQGLLQMAQDPTLGLLVDASARLDEDRIRVENSQTDEEGETDNVDWLDAVVAGANNDLERVVLLLVEGQRTKALAAYARWFVGTGGLTKSHGLLKGTPGSRTTWRFAPSNDLLYLLVQLAAARQIPPNTPSNEERVPDTLRLRDFLRFLEERFGILIDRPPASFTGADYAAAARANLQAMLGRLRQMGIFRDLSDDFTVQRLSPPYAGALTQRMEEIT